MKYKNLKDVFFDSSFHVGMGLSTYDDNLDKELFNYLPTISTIVNHEIAMNAIADSEIAMNAIADSEVAMNAIVDSEVVMNSIVDSEIAMNSIVDSEIAMNTIVDSEIAMNSIFNNLKAKEIMFGKDAVTKAIANNKNAINWLKNNKGIEANGYSINKLRKYDGKALLIEQWDSKNNSSITIRYGDKVGNIGETDRKLNTTKINNVMACQPFTMLRVGGTEGVSYCIYVPMDK